MDIHSVHWGRVTIAAVLSEVGVVAVLSLIIVAHRFLVAPGRSSADYRAFADRASYHVAPIAAGLAVFFSALWAARTLSSGFVVNGAFVGIIAVLLTVGFLAGAKPEHRFMYGVSFALRIVGGCLAGVVVQFRG